MTKYQQWIKEQDKEFIKLVHPVFIPLEFKDQILSGISIEELEELDNRFINNPEGE